MQKILFISHEASPTGAPRVLLNILQWIKQNTVIPFDILLLDGGELEYEFKELGTVYYWKDPQSEKQQSVTRRVFNRICNKNYNPKKVYNKKLLDTLQQNNYTIVYGNTLVSLNAIIKLTQMLPNIKIIVHVHELYCYSLWFYEQLKAIQAYDVTYISVSKVTTENLETNHHIPSKDIQLIYETIETKEVRKFRKERADTNFIVHGCGWVDVRKGNDIFMFVAQRAIQKYPAIPFLFQWIGKIPPTHKYFIENDIEKSGMLGKVVFIGELLKPYETFSQCDVYLMTSREDPFPLVCIEHAVLEKPIICFDKGTGVSEFVESDAGIIVPYMDIEAMADALAYLYQHPEKRKAMGTKAGEKAMDYDVSVQCPKILQVITNV